MTRQQSILLLHLIGEGGNIQIKANEASPHVPVYSETNESYDLDEEDADIPLQSITGYTDFRAYWLTLTQSTYWYLLRPVYVEPCLFDFIHKSLSDLNTVGMDPYKLRCVRYWLDITSAS